MTDGDDISETVLRQACADLDRRLRAGDGPRVEQILADRPLLAAREDAVVELVYTEFVTREELGHRPTPEEYCARFPAWQARLRRQFHVHGLFRDNQAADVPAPAGEEATMPARLGSHELMEEVARGTGGVVYRARHAPLGRVVALKVMRAEFGRKARARRRFCREAKILASLRHRNVVAVHDLGEQRGWLWYSMDFADGGSLARLKGPVTPSRAARLVGATASAVHHAHEAGVIHRDLKPSNVLLDADEEPLLSDFGLAWVRGEEETPKRGLAGTPAYMAPEQFAVRPAITPATDVWGLGVMLYELLAGRRPFTATSLDELRRAIREDDPPAVGAVTELEAVWRRCLAKEPAGRFPSAADVARELSGLGGLR